ncbi:MAG: FAD:protein FMN transferase [Bacteroidota bacterium]
MSKPLIDKSRIYPVVLLLIVFLVWKYRESQKEKVEEAPIIYNDKTYELISFSGKTMGPIIYSIKYYQENGVNHQAGVDSVLEVFNLSLNTYNPNSEISRFNRDTTFEFQLPYFHQVLARSKEISSLTGGAFDPTIGPFINAWGFGAQKEINPDSATIDSLKSFVGFSKINFDEQRVWKQSPAVKIDFSAIAKGQGVDVVADYLASKGIKNLFVEIGGEIVARGLNLHTKEPWVAGIIDPTKADPGTGRPELLGLVSLKNKAIATSGNYYNYRIIDSVRYSHTIDPASGFPIEHEILSASVFALDCMTADAFATAFMVTGHEKAIEIVEQNEGVDAYLVFSKPDGSVGTYASPGIAQHIENAK